MTIMLTCIGLVYFVLSIFTFFGTRDMEYKLGISTLMGLLFPLVVFSESMIKILSYVHVMFTKIILMLCFIDPIEFQTKLIERIIEKNNDQ